MSPSGTAEVCEPMSQRICRSGELMRKALALSIAILLVAYPLLAAIALVSGNQLTNFSGSAIHSTAGWMIVRIPPRRRPDGQDVNSLHLKIILRRRTGPRASPV